MVRTGLLTQKPKAALITQIKQEKSQRLDEADNIITYLQEAVDVDLATEEEATALQKWKNTEFLLNRVDISTAPDIEWPQSQFSHCIIVQTIPLSCNLIANFSCYTDTVIGVREHGTRLSSWCARY